MEVYDCRSGTIPGEKWVPRVDGCCGTQVKVFVINELEHGLSDGITTCPVKFTMMMARLEDGERVAKLRKNGEGRD